MDARKETGVLGIYEAADVQLHDIYRDKPRV
jgi:hypothetical protein